MFTGLIETVGRVRSMTHVGVGARLAIDAEWPDGSTPSQGDSIAVNGACLTALEPTADGFCADLSPETVKRTLLGALRSGARVNLERALRLGDRLGGHIVQGHVDTLVRLLGIRPEGSFQRWRLTIPPEYTREIAAKGSVALDGVSLTVSALGADWFEVALIPETLASTTLGQLTVNARLHLETDVLAKYVAQSLGGSIGGSTAGSAIDEIFGDGRA